MHSRLFNIITIITALALFGCSSTPSHVILAPQVTAPTTAIYNNLSANFSVQDLRAGNHLIQVLKKDKAAELFSPSQPLSQVIEQSLNSYYAKQGMSTSGGSTSITVNIDKAIVSVQQALMKYQANSDIQIRVVVTKGEKTITTTIKSKGNSKGPLQADIAVLERDLNQQLGKVISDIANNAEIIAFLSR